MRSYRSFASFSDPDGNGWLFQEVTARLPGRIDPDDDDIRLGERSGERAPACGGRARRAREANGGQRDENWPDWYAEYMVGEQPAERQ